MEFSEVLEATITPTPTLIIIPSPTPKPTPSPTPKSTEDIYNDAVTKYDNGEIELAQNNFSLVLDYKDSKDYIDKIKFINKFRGTWASYGVTLTFNGLNLIYNRERATNLKIVEYKENLYLAGVGDATHVPWPFIYTITPDGIIEYISVYYSGNDIKDIDFDSNMEFIKTSDETNATLRVKPYIGMTKEELKNDCIWGTPEDINTTTTAYGTREQWCFSGYRYVYLEDDIVTA